AGGAGGNGLGGGVFNATSGILTIAPRQGARKGSRQSQSTNTITANQANRGLGGSGGTGGGASGRNGQGPGGAAGQTFPGFPGAQGPGGLPDTGLGGAFHIATESKATIDNTTVTANVASTGGNDVSGTFST